MGPSTSVGRSLRVRAMRARPSESRTGSTRKIKVERVICRNAKSCVLTRLGSESSRLKE